MSSENQARQHARLRWSLQNSGNSAAEVRENVSQAIRLTQANQAKVPSIEPVDYETFIIQKKTHMTSDPQREMLYFPTDDVTEKQVPRKRRTVRSSIPDKANKEATSLFVKECIGSYDSDWFLVKRKYEAYSGDCSQLPRNEKEEPLPLPEQVYEVDAQGGKDVDFEDSITSSAGTTKQGYMYKTPFSGKSDPISMLKSFKRRYFRLQQLADKTYILEYYSNEKSSTAKGNITLDSLTKVVAANKGRKFGFELRMQDASVYNLAAENETDFDDWMATMAKVIQQNESAEKQSIASTDDIDDLSDPIPSPGGADTYQESLEQSKNPELIKFAKENEKTINLERRRNRQRLFDIYPKMQMSRSSQSKALDSDVKVYTEKFGVRFVLTVEDFKFQLSAPINDKGDVLESGKNPVNVEPFFLSLALYDAKECRKLSQDFHLDLNHPLVRAMLHPDNKDLPNGTQQNGDNPARKTGGNRGQPDLSREVEDCLKFPQKAIFSVTCPHDEIYLVMKVEKVLQGSVNNCADPYIRTGDTAKSAQKIFKQARVFCSRLGSYRMPFAWAYRSVFKPHSRMAVLSNDRFSPLYKQESSKLSDEDLLKHLKEVITNPERISKLQIIPGSIKCSLDPFRENTPNCLTPSLVPVDPFKGPSPDHPELPPIHLEMDEFMPEKGEYAHPYTTYTNHLFVAPISLKYDNQRTFPKARNIAVVVEFRDSDLEGSEPLRCIYGRPGGPTFVDSISCAVLHHYTSPEFYEQIKIALPTQLHEKHHLLFTFYHVSCEQSKGTVKRKEAIETMVGYAWVPILQEGSTRSAPARINVDEIQVAVASNMPSGYLSSKIFGLGKTSGPDVKWVDGCKQLFKVNNRLVSTIYTKDQHVHNFFSHCQVSDNSSNTHMEMCKLLKAMHAVDPSTMIRFLPVILNQLFRILPNTSVDDVQSNVVRLLIHIVSQVNSVNKEDVLHAYVKYVFFTEKPTQLHKTIHEELVKNMAYLLRPNIDFMVTKNLMKHAWFFFEIVIKSMAQYLIYNDKMKEQRSRRFPANFQYGVENLLLALMPHIRQKYKDSAEEIRRANLFLATFVKNCFTYMDRGFVFKLINKYMEAFNPGDDKPLLELKFEFLRVICNHEHFIALNLPIMKRGNVKQYKDFHHDYSLTDEFCRNHFLVGLLMRELQGALYEVKEVRQAAISVLRNLLAKHSFDDRYNKTKYQQPRIAALYLPILSILLENTSRFSKDSPTPSNGGDPTGSTATLKSSVSVPGDNSQATTLPGRGRDSTVLDIIALPSKGVHSISSPRPMGDEGTGNASKPMSGSNASLSSNSTNSTLDKVDRSTVDGNGHNRSASVSMVTAGKVFVRCDKLEEEEMKDLLLCFLYIVKNVQEEILMGWWNQSTANDQVDFFTILEICLHKFRYLGKKQIIATRTFDLIKRPFSQAEAKAMTLPATRRPISTKTLPGSLDPPVSYVPSTSEADAMYRSMLEANIATEVGIVVLDIFSLYCLQQKAWQVHLLEANGDNPRMRKIFDILLAFLQMSQSESMLKHAFAALRVFITRFPGALFKGTAHLCANLCYEILRCCNSRLPSTRNEACALAYLLMRNNFEHTGRREFVRVHIQVIIAVSRLISDVIVLNSGQFQESLAIINNFAHSDRAMQHTQFPAQVKDLTKKVRTVLMATAQMKEYENDPEMLVDLQYSLAKSYASTPELRKTWLESMAKIHIKGGDFSEAAHCYIHIAALVAEYLRRKSQFPRGCSAFKNISPNIESDESGMKDDSGMQDTQYTEEDFLGLLEDCAAALEKAERYELLGEIYRLIIPFYEKHRDFQSLSQAYACLARAYSKIVEVIHSGRRLLGKYFRVAFYGQQYFEEEDGKEYIYKEPKITGLADIATRLQKMYEDKYGANNVKLIRDSNKVNPKDLDAKYAYIQVTYVEPYFDDKELKERRTDFERNNNIRRFMYETPFTTGGKAHAASLEEQRKRRTILTTENSFPYVKKRIQVIYQLNQEMSPIEVAIDQMKTKVQELTEVVNKEYPDKIKLQLKLQGSVSVTVNAGPLAYASAFLEESTLKSKVRYPRQHVNNLKQIFRDFVKILGEALELNAKLIKSDQLEYHEDMKQKYRDMAIKLGTLLEEELLPEEFALSGSMNRSSMFNAISGISTSSTSA